MRTHKKRSAKIISYRQPKISRDLQNKQSGGSTDINSTLIKAIELIKMDISALNDDNFFINQIIFLTDGEPNAGIRDTKQTIANVKDMNNLTQIDKYNSKIAIFSFGIGKDQNDSSWINDLKQKVRTHRKRSAKIIYFTDWFGILISYRPTKISRDIYIWM